MYKIHFVRFMRKIDRYKRKINNFMYDHIHLKEGLSISKALFFATFSALLYALGFYCFISPYAVDHTTIAGSAITTGGVGGISQVIWMFINLVSGGEDIIDIYTLQSIGYFALNIPILIFSFFKIGKKFTIITLINVGLSSLFITLFKNFELANKIAENLQDEHLARVLFAGVCVGCASATAFRNGVSCGGIDVISYYFSLRKSTSVGKYATAINAGIVVTYALLTIGVNNGKFVEVALLNLMYSVVYLFTTMLVVDFINIRNKKVQIQIITQFKDISSVLIANFPHSTTTMAGKGGYSHADREVVYMVVSSSEVKRVISLVKKVDPHSFVTVTALVQAYGNFFIKPVE